VRLIREIPAQTTVIGFVPTFAVTYFGVVDALFLRDSDGHKYIDGCVALGYPRVQFAVVPVREAL